MADVKLAIENEVTEQKPQIDNRDEVKSLALKINEQKQLDIKRRLYGHKIAENIPQNSVILDVGCWGGETGVTIASDTDSSLIQADWTDSRNLRAGELKIMPKAIPGAQAPDFYGTHADVALLIDVVQHVGFGNGWDKTRNKPDPDGRFKDVMKFITGVATGVKEDGKILIVNTRQEGEDVVELLKGRLEQNEELKDKIKIV